MRVRRSLRLAVLCLVSAAVPAQAAEQFAGVTRDGAVVLFRSDSPGAVRGAAQITGLALGERVVGVSVRPADGRLYALGSGSRLYLLNPVTGVASLLNSPFFPALAGGRFGFSTDPNTDRFAVTSDQGQQLRLDENGQVVAASGVGTYAQGDPGAGVAPRVSAIAFSNNVRGARATQMYGIDTERQTLVLFAAATQTLQTIGALGIDTRAPAGFTIASDGTAWAALRAEGNFPLLSRVDLATGAATLISELGTARIARRTSSRSPVAVPVESIAALGQVPDDKQAPRVVVDAPTRVSTRELLTKGLPLEISCDEACTISISAAAGNRSDAGEATGEIQATAGRRVVRLRISGETRDLLRSRESTTVRLRVGAIDAAGNATTLRRSFVALTPASAVRATRTPG